MNFEIRKAKLADLNEVRNLFEHTIIHTCKQDYTDQQLRVWKSASQQIDKWKTALKEEYFIVTEHSNKIVGFSSLKNGNYLNLMYVHKDFIRLGIANMMFAHLKEKSRSLGHDKLTADVSTTARPFFEKKGFKVMKENHNLIDEIMIINYDMSE